MNDKDKIVISLGDSLLRESDIALLNPPNWLNDRLIGFYFEYLHLNNFENSNKICFISPEVSQFLKLVSYEEIPVFLEPLELETKEVVVLAVNDANDPSLPGGSHWSLLIYTSQAKEFYHMDSGDGSNDSDARQIAVKLHEFLSKKHLEGNYFSNSKFEFNYSNVPVLKQTNGYDCGIHVLCHAEATTRHFLVYGNPKGLELLDIKTIKSKREEIKELISNACKNGLNRNGSTLYLPSSANNSR